MADRSFSTKVACYFLLVWIELFTGILNVSDGVIITPRSTDVLARARDGAVTLPCNFTTNTYDMPLITWFRYRGIERRRIMQFRFNTLISYGELLNRVARGDRGALVLIKPTVEDSGKYSCEVEVDKENPNFAIADVTLTVTHPVSHGVNVTPMKTPILAKDTDTVVTLPCNFTTNSYETPRITWFRYRDGERRQIMMFQNNRLTSYRKMLNRAARGDRGALVLIRPTVEDSGNYSCEVEVEGESPNWVKADLYLEVTSHDVTIPTVRPITVKDTDASVTLPCDFTTDGTATPRIHVAWRQLRDGNQRQIVTFDEHGVLFVDNKFVDRVARGHRGALVLISPTVEDEGTFTCAVHMDDDNWVSINITLSVVHDHRDTVLDPIIGLICLMWITPVCFGFILEIKVYDQIRKLYLQKKSRKQLLMKGWRCIPILLALCLTFCGTVKASIALSSTDNTSFNYDKRNGYGAGVSGIIILCVIYICLPLINMFKKQSCRKETRAETDTEQAAEGETDKNDDNGQQCSKPGTSATSHPLQEETPLMTQNEMKDDNGQQCLKPGTFATTDPVQEETPLMTAAVTPSFLKEKDRPTFKIMNKPTNDNVTGMVSMSHKELYLTTSSKLYHIDTSVVSNEFSHVEELEREEQLMMVCKYEKGVLLLAKSYESKIFSPDCDKYHFLTLHPNNKKIYKVTLESDVSWVFSEMHSGDIYLTLPDRREIVRGNIIKDKMVRTKTIDTCVLKYPSCIVKNSKGQIIVADSGRNDVFVFDENTGFVTSMKISVPRDLEHELNGCNKLTLGTSDIIYVTGPNSANIFVFGADFRFEGVIQTDTGSSGLISCITIHNNSLYVAHEDCIRIYPVLKLK